MWERTKMGIGWDCCCIVRAWSFRYASVDSGVVFSQGEGGCRCGYGWGHRSLRLDGSLFLGLTLPHLSLPSAPPETRRPQILIAVWTLKHTTTLAPSFGTSLSPTWDSAHRAFKSQPQAGHVTGEDARLLVNRCCTCCW